MQCPRLAELPPPPEGKTGWPWTVETPPLPPTRPDGSSWPRISIVTPSYNQGQFIEETIRSVLLQGYPDLEYIIMDGGSTDGSVEIIRKYERWFAYWNSGPDAGQSAAIKSGISKASGDILAWINSDDGYLLSTFERVVSRLWGVNLGLIYSNHIRKEVGKADRLVRAGAVRAWYLTCGGFIPQHTAFWTSDFGLNVDDSIVCNFDSELWYRMVPRAKRIIRLREPLAYYYAHPDQKTISEKWKQAWEEDNKIIGSKHKRRVDRIVRFEGAIGRIYRIEYLLLGIRDRIEELLAIGSH